MKTAMKKPKARLEVSLGIRLMPAEKAAIEIWAKREERSPSVVVRRRRSCDCPTARATTKHGRTGAPSALSIPSFAPLRGFDASAGPAHGGADIATEGGLIAARPVRRAQRCNNWRNT